MYSERLIALFHSRAHAGRLENATHYGEAGTPSQGPYTRLWLRVRDGVIEAAAYQT
jgi:NifU-like protein involved in Fe-S cluster formation